MPEIKNTFTQGRMNKDLDERIIPNGEYRDALNIKVNSSDDASVGTVQNILGNKGVDLNGIVPSDYLCIATIADEKTNKLYWFVTKELIPIHAILQYDLNAPKYDAVKVVLLDKNNSALKFTRNIITGINIIDNLLFWTDNNSEPKKINIDDCIKGSVTMDLDTAPQTVLVDSEGVKTFIEIEEKHITVIKKAPRLAPFTTIIPNYNLEKETPLFEKVFPRFSYRYKYKDGEYSSFGPFTDVIFKPIYKENINIDNAYSLEEGNNTGMTNNIKAILFSKYNYENTPDDVVQIELLYKEEGSSTVFSVKKINNDDYAWTQNSFTLESKNIFAAIPENQLLRPWDNVPLKALSQEVTGNRIVYGNYTQGRNLITSDSSKAVPIITASYEQRNLNYFPANSDINLGGVKSLKSKREYSVGYVWGDKYGRETPVLDNIKNVSIPWFDSEINLTASNSTSLQVNLIGNKPYWADYYKFYVKEKSGEYYNLLMEKAYFTEKVNIFDKDEERIWLGFISADRNKVLEDGYITLKKKIGGNQRQVALDNKFKILDIQNEAPDAIKYKYVDLGTVTQTTLSGSGVLQTIFSDADNRPDDQIDMLYIHRSEWVNSVGGSLQQKNDNAEMWVDAVLYASWKDNVTGQHSERYKIISSVFNGNEYMLKLDRVISKTDADIAKNESDGTLLGDNLQFTIEKREEVEAEEFAGKFFVQISSLSTVQSSPEIISLENFQVTSDANTFWFYDDATTPVFGPGTTTPSPEPATVASVTTMSITDYTNTPEEWAELAQEAFGDSGKGFFIDNLFMAAGQMSSSNYAKSTGRTWTGRSDMHAPTPLWGKLLTTDDTASTINPPERPYGWGLFPAEQDGEQTNVPLVDYIFDNNEDSKSGTSWPSGMWSQGQFLTTQSIPHIPRTVQSMEGIFTTSSKHYLGSPFPGDNGYRRWRKEGSVSYNALPFRGYWNNFTPEQTYGDESGVHYVQVSFLAPGENLHDGNFDGLQDDCRKWGEGSIGNYLQAIWGGGIFAGGASGGSPNFDLDDYLDDPDSLNSLVVEMEGNYDPVTNAPLEDAPAPGIGYGYDTSQDYVDKHNNQWNPYWKNDPDGKIKAFIDNISAGSTFVFPTAPDEKFTILANPIVKHVYNHTVWNRDYRYNGVDDYTELTGAQSVSNRVLKWANNTSGSGGQQSSMTNLQNAIFNFGKADNRRVVYIFPVDKNPLAVGGITDANFNTELDLNIKFVSNDSSTVLSQIMTEPAIWETEPKESEGLDIYYEVSQAYPTVLTNKTNVEFAPVGCYVEISAGSARNGQFIIENKMRLAEWIDENTFKIATKEINKGFNTYESDGSTLVNYEDALVKFYRRDGSYTTAKITGQPSVANVTEFENVDEDGVGYGSYELLTSDYYNTFTIQEIDPSLGTGLSYYNCFSFGNGIESNRIRDDFNSPTIKNGVKASIVLESDYKEEKRKSGLIFSGIYNSNSGVNNLNQFIMADNITKDLNPTYGSIQKLFQRRISLVALCEDKVVSITSNKDALFNADGNAQLVSTNAVLGDATPFVGDFGISKNPESFAKESYRAYFADKQRGAVLRLSMDGLTPISDSGMSDYFRDNLKLSGQIVGSYDAYSRDYNLSLKSQIASENFISNAFLDDGNNLIEDTPVGSIDLVRNGNVNNSTPLIQPAENLTVNQGFGELNNRYLNFKVDITNHDEILAGSLAPSSENTTLTQQTFKTFSNSTITVNQMGLHGGSNSGNPFTATGSGYGGSDKKYRALRTYTSTFVTENNAGNVVWPSTSAGIYSSNSGLWYTGLDPSNPNVAVGPSGDIFWNSVSDGYFAQGAIANEAPFGVTSSHRNPWFNTTSSPNSGRGICFDKTDSTQYLILPGDKVNSNDVTTPPPVLAKYTNAVPTTIFNGEEIRILFNARGLSYVTPNSPQTGSSSDHHRYATIHLYDGAIALTDSVIMDPANLQGSITQGYADYDYVPIIQSSQGTSDECRIGFQTTVDVDFPPLEHNTVRAHDVSFKFTNGTDESEAIIVQDLRVHIRFADVDGNQVDELYGSVESFAMQKRYYMSDVDTFSMVTSSNGDFVPQEDIGAWAEVNRIGFDNWVVQDEIGPIDEEGFAPNSLIDFGNDYIAVPTNITQLFSQNNVLMSNVVPTFLMPPDPSGTNGVVAYNDYVTGTETVNDKFAWVGDGNNHNYLVQSFTATVGEKYAIALTKPSSPTGDAPTLESYNLPFVLTQVHFDFEPDQPLIDAYLCIFDGDDSISELKIKLPSNASFEIESINMIKVTDIWSGGAANEWNFNIGTQGNPSPETSFDTPKLYATDSDGIHFHNTFGGYLSAFQQQLNLEDPQSINNLGNGGLKLSFTASNVAQGALSFFLIDGNGAGQWGDNIVDRNGLYEIDLNLDAGVYDVEIDGTVTHQTQDVSNHGTSQTNILNFFDSSGFVGDIDNIKLTNLQATYSGGSANSFTFSGPLGWDPVLDNYITFYMDNNGDGAIQFNDCPGVQPTSPVSFYQLQQELGQDTAIGEKYKVRFNHDFTTGGVNGYYYNSNGQGFIIGNGAITGTDTYNVIHTIGDHVNPNPSVYLTNTLVIYSNSGGPNSSTNGFIDNILFRQEFTTGNEETISFSEDVRGWTSFKSFLPEQGVSISSSYFTFNTGQIYEHNIKTYVDINDVTHDHPRNEFYGVPYFSSITAVLNSEPSIIKSFNTLNYEGSQSNVVKGDQYVRSGNTYSTVKNYNILPKKGWSVEYIQTNKQEGSLKEFIEKEGKWFNYVKGSSDPLTPDTSDLSFQGLGTINKVD
tara:strand:- start:4020 stop:12338 length:8319 start_codon:yes stop_codon:yes gene_type:complete